ncbi:type II toxin-antitoxin system RelE family toxin [Acidithiobacillus ferrianus]|uniref:type II toxin-antitoxin system RelE family toxin n=1 Tax=Acidithiobacillus ferrianus TaxID=2678518 RepID=UPI003F735F0C
MEAFRAERTQIPGRTVIPKVLAAVEALSSNPYPTGVKKLMGSAHTYRIRVGDYRTVYTVIAQELAIDVIRVGHRKEIYLKP